MRQLRVNWHKSRIPPLPLVRDFTTQDRIRIGILCIRDYYLDARRLLYVEDSCFADSCRGREGRRRGEEEGRPSVFALERDTGLLNVG